MIITVKVRHLRISPRKTRLVADLVRSLKVEDSINQLNYCNKKAALPIKKLINSAIATAVNDFELEKSNLFIKEIRVDEGVTIKRWMPKAHGRATTIRKRMSHILLSLGEIKDSGEKKAKKQKIEKPIKLDSAPANKKEEQEKEVVDKKGKESKKNLEEKGKEIIDPRSEGKGKNTKIEGKKGFAGKIFRRKSG